MPAFTFQIRPVALAKGFDLTCEGVLPNPVRHRRLIEAVIHSVELGHFLDAQIHIFDCSGAAVETLPVKWHEKRARAVRKRAARPTQASTFSEPAELQAA